MPTSDPRDTATNSDTDDMPADTSAGATQESRTEIHVESHSSQHIVGGRVRNGAPDTVGPAGLEDDDDDDVVSGEVLDGDGEEVVAGDEEDGPEAHGAAVNAPTRAAAGAMFEAQMAELEADLKRVQADFQNFKRRSTEERAELLDVAKAAVVEKLLPLFDNLDRALAHKPEDLAGNAWADGVEHVAAGLPAALAKLGVERIAAVGADFDPHLHEAVAMEDGDGSREVVVEELQAGYRIGERVLRPALVKVKRTA